MRSADLIELARAHGFELAGVTTAGQLPESEYYLDWATRGMAGDMHYLTDHRAQKRRDVRNLLPSAKSVLVVGKLYNTEDPYSVDADLEGKGWISRYAWSNDYHTSMKQRLTSVAEKIASVTSCEYKVCVDTAPLLERALAKQAGLGWIGKNTCLINQQQGSWFFLGEILLSLDLQSESATPPPDRCGTCTRCISACPTDALIPNNSTTGPSHELDARRCISYFTIELRGTIPEDMRQGMGSHIFGCDICQDVCPWNRKAPTTSDPAFQARNIAPSLEEMAALSPQQFHQRFQNTPVERTRHRGFLRNVAVAMGNTRNRRFESALQSLALHEDAVVRRHATWGLDQLL